MGGLSVAKVKHDEALNDEGFSLSALVSTDGIGQSYSKAILNKPGPTGQVMCGIWKAEPGEFRHPGGEHGETFVVIAGTASFHVEGEIAVELSAGSIVTVPPNTPTSMQISETLSKVAVIVPDA